MPFYRKKANFHTLQNSAEPLLLLLRSEAEVVKEDPDEPYTGVTEAFYVTKPLMDRISVEYANIFYGLKLGDFIEVAPLNYERTEAFVFVLEDKATYLPTISKSHMRLPKLSHLITLTPSDFFSIFQILAAGRPVATGTSIFISGETEFNNAISPFFVTNDKTWRINPDYADRKWTRRDDIEFISRLEPTQINQLYAMQYLTARQNPDLLYFPIESAVELELIWDQISEDYVVPEQEG